MNLKEIKKGLIVVVKEGEACGNASGTITKVLSRPGEVDDIVFKQIGRNTDRSTKNHVLCMCQSRFYGDIKYGSIKYNNTPAWYEIISDLRRATILEKKLYARGIITICPE